MAATTYVLRTSSGYAAVATPQAVVGYDMTRQGRSTFHHTMAVHRVTPRPASLRTGTITLLFGGATAEADALAAERSIATGIVHTLTATDWTTRLASLDGMRWALDGPLRRYLDPESRLAWLLDITLQEVD